MRLNILFSLLIILVIGWNLNNIKGSSNFLTVTGDKEILKNIKINLIFYYNSRIDSLLVFKEGVKLKTVNAEYSHYKYIVSYKDSLSVLCSFDNPVKVIGKEKWKHHWHILMIENKLYANFGNKLYDTFNKSSILFKKKN